MKCIAGSLLIMLLITGCMENAADPQSYLPRDGKKTVDASLDPADSVATFILTAGNVLHYAGKFNHQTKASLVSYKNLRETVLDYKKRFGDHIVVVIKPHENATYKNTVSMLDEITINDIKRYAMVELIDEERKVLNLPFPETPDNAITVTAPKPVKLNTTTHKTDFVITIHKDESLSYNNNKSISPPTKENIKRILLSYKDSIGKEGDRIRIIIRGPKQAAYNSFSPVIQALKELDIYKFSFEEEPVN